MKRNTIVVMPFAALERPSLAASMIQAGIRNRGHRCDVHYANLRFANQIGLSAYSLFNSICPDPTDLFGDWIFSHVAFDRQRLSERYVDECIAQNPRTFAYLKQVFGSDTAADLKLKLDHLRNIATKFAQQTAKRILSTDPDTVGATTMFQQNTSSMAVLRMIKEQRPAVRTILGGANCEEPMGSAWQEICPWIDEVHKGRVEGHIERVFELDESATRRFDATTYPDYSDYFSQLSAVAYRDRIRPSLPIEMSTGCWYGEKSHCTFCGLNAGTMRFKARDADEVFDELRHQKQRYTLNRFMAVDNIIPMHYFDTLWPRIIDAGLDINMFVETKANLKRRQVEMLAEAGLRWIQPGIEALDDDKLKRFRKGTDLRTNVTLLKLCLEQGIAATWGLLVCEPGDDAAEYRRMADIIPKIVHLYPPSGTGPVRFDRYSPYHSCSAEFGLRLVPHKAYRYVYPQRTDLKNAAYYFEDPDYDVVNRDNTDLLAMAERQRQWSRAFFGSAEEMGSRSYPHAVLEIDFDTGRLVDSRAGHTKLAYVPAADRHVLRDLHEGMPKARFHERYPDRDLSALMKDDLVIDTGQHYVSVVTFPPVRSLPRHQDFPGGFVAN